MPVFKIGDRVSVLKETIKGSVLSIEGNQITIEDQDGFSRKYWNRQLVKLQSEKSYKLPDQIQEKEVSKKLNKISSTNRVTDSKPFIDLHIEALIDSHQGMLNHEILQKQMFACRNFVQKSLLKRPIKIFLIHGKGEGVLKAEVHHYLSRLSHRQGIKLDYHEAPYSMFGMEGATEVILH